MDLDLKTKKETLNSEGIKEDRESLLKTIESLQKDQADSENQRKAIFNILEDVDEAQIMLKKRYSELNVIRRLVQNLGNSLQTKVIMETLILAMKESFPKDVNFTFVIPSSNPANFSNSIYIYASSPLGNNYLKFIKKNFAKTINDTSEELKIKKELVEWIENRFLFEFVEGKKDGNETRQPLSFFDIPLVVRNELLGIIDVSSLKSGLFTKKEVDFANTMVNITANTISRLRQLLDAEQSRTQSLVKDLSNGIIMFDFDKKITMINQAAQGMTKLSGKGVFLSEFMKLLEKQDSEKINQKITEALKGGESFSFEEIKISRFIYEIIITPVHDNNKEIVGGAIILHDVTHFKEVDRMKTEFVSVASHQLRTPLTAIMLFAEMLAGEEVGSLSPGQKDYIENIQQSTKRMIKLVNDLLNVSRIETGRLKIEPEPTHLDEFIKGIINESMPVIEKQKGELVFERAEEKDFTTLIDQTLVQQVIHNLITNAIRYSAPGKCSILVKLDQNDNDYIISVRDNGIGVPKEVQSRIFQKFFRADNAQKKEVEGSGLGLYVAKMIIEASGGKIWFESTQDKGTTFFVSLPKKGMNIKKGEVGIIAQ